MLHQLLLAALLLSRFLHFGAGQRPCLARSYDGNVVCVCNATYCDDFPELGTLQSGEAVVFKSSMDGKRFQKTKTRFQEYDPSVQGVPVMVNGQVQYQSIIGFGGAFTDAAGFNLNSLSSDAAQELMRSYFGQDGLQYSLGRVPIASCDFSTHEYSYDDVEGDFELRHFNLTTEDRQAKIPYIRQALALTNGEMKLFASPWSAPPWMKTNGHMRGGGKLKPDEHSRYHKTWANYFVRFLEAYHDEGVGVWGITVQNEPSSGSLPDYPWQTMFFSSDSERVFIRDYLGPTLKESSLGKDVSLMIMDDNRYFLPHWADSVLSDEAAEQYVSGIAVHWYGDYPFVPASLLSETHRRHPHKFILASEACNGAGGLARGPVLGDWYRADSYAHDIIEDLSNWVSGWTDWNLCLDLKGGPNWVQNYADAPVIVNASADEFYKQPMFYIMGHFSKVIRPGSQRIQLTLGEHAGSLEGVAMVTSSRRRVLVLSNRNDQLGYKLSIRDAAIDALALSLTLEPRTIATVVWDKHI